MAATVNIVDVEAGQKYFVMHVKVTLSGTDTTGGFLIGKLATQKYKSPKAPISAIFYDTKGHHFTYDVANKKLKLFGADINASYPSELANASDFDNAAKAEWVTGNTIYGFLWVPKA